jgi:hypothetical protein
MRFDKFSSHSAGVCVREPDDSGRFRANAELGACARAIEGRYQIPLAYVRSY